MEADPVSPVERDGNHGEQPNSGRASPSRRASDPGPRRARIRACANQGSNGNQSGESKADAALSAFGRLPDELIERSVALSGPSFNIP